MTDALDVHDAVWPLLDAVPGVHTYDGEIVDDDGRPTSPPLDEDDRVAAYAVLYLSAGRLLSLTLNATQDSLATTFQVTCVGGDPTRALWCVDQVRGALVGATVTFNDRDYEIRASEVTPAPLPPEEGVKPPRHTIPVLFSLFVP